MWDEKWNLWDLYNCAPAFQYECPRQWEQLRETNEPGVRFCGGREQVYFCNTPEEFVRQGELGRCVAIPAALTIKRELVPDFRSEDEREPMMLGLVDYTPQIKERATRMAFWAEVLKLNPDLPHEYATLDDAAAKIEEFRQEEIAREKDLETFHAEQAVWEAAEQVRLDRQVKVRAELARIAAMSNQEAWGLAGNCPKCGFAHRWDGAHCSHCGHPHPLP